MKGLHFFDYLQEVVYAADVNTYELVYLNQVGMQYVGCHSLRDIKGKKCYKVFYGKDLPCDFCTNKLLTEGEFFEWRHRNERLNRSFLLRDTLFSHEGKQHRLEIGVDLNKIEQDTICEIQNYKEHEKIINEGLSIALSEKDADLVIQRFLEYLGEKSFAQRCYIFENRGRTIDNTYEWCASGVSEQKSNLQGVPIEVVDVWYDAFRESGNAIIYHLEDIKNDKKDLYDVLKPQGIETLIVYPIEIDKKVVGFYGVDNIPRDLMKDVSVFLSIVSKFFSILIRNRDLTKHLEYIGHYDALTTLLNRPPAEEQINHILEKGTGTFLLFDLDGFKSVNDLLGHQQGDTLLNNVAIDTKTIFRETDIVFRLGGDEFGVFLPSLTDKNIIAKKCTELLGVISRNIGTGDKVVRVSCSIGIAIADSENLSFASLYTMADTAMYKAKKQSDKKYVFFTEADEDKVQ